MLPALLPGTALAAERTSGWQGLEGPSESAADALGTSLALDSSGSVALKEGTYENWIDRVQLPEYALKFYEMLEEASDNDGYNDYLIDDRYFDTTQSGKDYKELKAGEIYYENGRTAIVAAVIEGIPYDSDWAAVNAVYEEASKYIVAAFNAFSRDHNEVFWVDNHYSWGYKSYSPDRKTATVWLLFDLRYYANTYVTDLRLNNYDAAGVKSAIAAMERNIAGILSGIPEGADRYETLAYFNEWLTTHNEYNTGDIDNGPWDIRCASNALEGKSGDLGPVCESYARAFKVLCDRAGIPCTLVNGGALNSASDTQPEAHMWNYVQMENGKWYAVDVTWNDPIYTSNGVTQTGKVSGGETDKWLLLGEHTLVDTGFAFIRSHPVSNQVTTIGASFTNGPALNPTAYARLTYSGMPQTLETGGAVALTANRFPARKRDLSTYSYSVTGGALPEGLTLDRTTGAISGTPTDAAIQNTPVTVTLYENGLAAASCDIVFPGAEPVYMVTVSASPADGGTVAATPAFPASGATVTVTAVPYSGHAIGSVTVTSGNGSRIPVTSIGGGVYTFTMPDASAAVSVTFDVTETPWVNPFTDVSQRDWFYDGVAYAARNGLVSGVGGGRFDPGGTATRGMIVTLLYNLTGKPPVASGSSFTDVPAGQYYADAVAWAAANNIVAGNGDNTFNPGGKITREQMATILYNYAAYMGYDVSGRADLSGYADVGSVSSWALTAMRWANREDLVSGRTASTLVPKGTATRAETAVLLSKFCRQIAGME